MSCAVGVLDEGIMAMTSDSVMASWVMTNGSSYVMAPDVYESRRGCSMDGLAAGELPLLLV